MILFPLFSISMVSLTQK